MIYSSNDTALVVIDPQNDVLSEHGVSWDLVGESIQENNTVENLARLFAAAKENDFQIFVSPHYLYPADQMWAFGGPVEKMMLDSREFYRADPLSLDDFARSGADWLERYKPFIDDGKTVVVSPHKMWGPQTNDLVLQLRKRGISKIILAGMLANLCVESHLRELLEQGFEVAVVKDATAAPRHPDLGDGYKAAIVNYQFLANAVLSTDESVTLMSASTTANDLVAPPFDLASATHKVRLAEDAWNSRDPSRVSLAYTEDSIWRNRSEFVTGRDAIRTFLAGKWEREHEYRLVKSLWGYKENRMAVRFQYEWHDVAGNWYRSYGNELWEFDESGLMRRREASINDVPILESARRFFWKAPGPRPADHPGITEIQ